MLKDAQKTEQPQLDFVAEATHHTHQYGDFIIHIVKNTKTQKEHVVLTKGQIVDQENVPCRVASECLPGTVFDSADCECKDQIDLSLQYIAEHEQGLIILLRQEGRGQGLETKIKALANKNKGFDTFAAVEALGKEADVREYWEAAEIIRHFKIKSINLLTNNPDKIKEIEHEGITVSQVTPVEVAPTTITEKHLKAKKARGHLLKLV